MLLREHLPRFADLRVGVIQLLVCTLLRLFKLSGVLIVGLLRLRQLLLAVGKLLLAVRELLLVFFDRPLAVHQLLIGVGKLLFCLALGIGELDLSVLICLLGIGKLLLRVRKLLLGI